MSTILSPPTVLRRLGPLAVEDFMARYWQRKPCLIRRAFASMQPPLSRAALFALAARDDVQSRLVTAFDGRWRLQHGPFARLPSRTRPQWTLLVQGVDLHDDAAAQLLSVFRFVPDARLDDLMISYATDQGGVGPHVDSYDVFLLQAAGRRRWRISRQRDLAFVNGLPLRILADFRPTQEWVLEPGDMLYLPPGVAHEGVALGDDCMTCSIGFRAPRYRELMDDCFDAVAQRVQLDSQYRDPGLAATRRPAQLPAALIDAAARQLQQLTPTREDVRRALLARLSAPADEAVFSAPRPTLAQARFAQRAARQGLGLDRRTRLLYDGGMAGINGEALPLAAGLRKPIQRLADRRALAADDCGALPETAVALLYDWYAAGWLHLSQSSSQP